MRDENGDIIMEKDVRVQIHDAPITTYPQSLWLYNKDMGGPIDGDFETIKHAYYSFDMIPDQYKVVKAVLTSPSGQLPRIISIPFGKTSTVKNTDDTDICTIKNVNGYLFLTYTVWEDDYDHTSPLPSPNIEIPDAWFATIPTDD